MRIVSLVPHATELLFALGLGEEVVGVTHECDHPRRGAGARRGSPATCCPRGLSAARDRRRRARAHAGGRGDLRARRATALAAPRARADRHPGALPGVRRLLRGGRRARRAGCPRSPRVIALDPRTLGETLGDVRTLAAGDRPAATQGVELVARDRRRGSTGCELAVRGRRRARGWRPSSGSTPSIVAGHWTPQLIELAGGEDVLGPARRALADRRLGGAWPRPRPRSWW